MNLYRHILDELEDERQRLYEIDRQAKELRGLEYAVCLIKNVKSNYDKVQAQRHRERRRALQSENLHQRGRQ
jgi:hypothetical protein